MFLFINKLFRRDDNGVGMAQIATGSDGKFGLFDHRGRLLGTYGRSRDAIRGAKRRGLNVL